MHPRHLPLSQSTQKAVCLLSCSCQLPGQWSAPNIDLRYTSPYLLHCLSSFDCFREICPRFRTIAAHVNFTGQTFALGVKSRMMLSVHDAILSALCFCL